MQLIFEVPFQEKSTNVATLLMVGGGGFFLGQANQNRKTRARCEEEGMTNDQIKRLLPSVFSLTAGHVHG